MERAVDGDGIGKDYFRVWRETLFILRLSLADVTTLCLGFKNCTVALFFRDTDPNFGATFCDAASLYYSLVTNMLEHFCYFVLFRFECQW